MSLEQLMGRRYAPELGGYTTPLTADVSDLPERLGKAISGAQQSILLERGIEQQTSQDLPEEAVSPEYQEHIIDFSQLYTPQPRVERVSELTPPVPQEQPIEATPVPKQPVVAPAPVITSPLQQLSQELKEKTPELSGYSSTTPTTRADGWNGMRNGVPIGRDNPFAPITETPAPVVERTRELVIEAPADVQPVEQTAPPSIDEQLANLNAQANGDGTYGSFLPSNPELKSQAAPIEYEPLAADEGWKDKDFKGWMKGYGNYPGSAIPYIKPGEPYPSADGTVENKAYPTGQNFLQKPANEQPIIRAKDGFYQPNSSGGMRPYKVGQAVIGHPDFGNYKAYWTGDKFVSLQEFYRRWQTGEMEAKQRKFGTGFMEMLEDAYNQIPEPVRNYVEKGLKNQGKQDNLTTEMLTEGLPGMPDGIRNFMASAFQKADETGTDAFLTEVASKTSFDKDFLGLVINGLMMLAPYGSSRSLQFVDFKNGKLVPRMKRRKVKGSNRYELTDVVEQRKRVEAERWGDSSRPLEQMRVKDIDAYGKPLDFNNNRAFPTRGTGGREGDVTTRMPPDYSTATGSQLRDLSMGKKPVADNLQQIKLDPKTGKRVADTRNTDGFPTQRDKTNARIQAKIEEVKPRIKQNNPDASPSQLQELVDKQSKAIRSAFERHQQAREFRVSGKKLPDWLKSQFQEQYGLDLEKMYLKGFKLKPQDAVKLWQNALKKNPKLNAEAGFWMEPLMFSGGYEKTALQAMFYAILNGMGG